MVNTNNYIEDIEFFLEVSGKYYLLDDTVCRIFSQLSIDNINRQNVMPMDDENFWDDFEVEEQIDFSKDTFVKGINLFLQEISDLINKNKEEVDYVGFENWVEHFLNQRNTETNDDNVEFLTNTNLFRTLVKDEI